MWLVNFSKVAYFLSRVLSENTNWLNLRVLARAHAEHYGNRSVQNLIYTGLLSADRRLPYISDNEEVGTSINFIKTVAVV